MVNIISRDYPNEVAERLAGEGVHPVLARVYAARGITAAKQLQTALGGLIPPDQLRNVSQMAVLLADAIAQGKKLLIVADYDSDGATACAVGVRGAAHVRRRCRFLVPNRFEYGYGLTPEIVQLAAQSQTRHHHHRRQRHRQRGRCRRANRLGIAGAGDRPPSAGRRPA